MWQAPTSAFSALPFRWLSWLGTTRATLTAAPIFAYRVLGRYASRLPKSTCVQYDSRSTAASPSVRFRHTRDVPGLRMAESTCAVSITRRHPGVRGRRPRCRRSRDPRRVDDGRFTSNPRRSAATTGSAQAISATSPPRGSWCTDESRSSSTSRAAMCSPARSSGSSVRCRACAPVVWWQARGSRARRRPAPDAGRSRRRC